MNKSIVPLLFLSCLVSAMEQEPDQKKSSLPVVIVKPKRPASLQELCAEKVAQLTLSGEYGTDHESLQALNSYIENLSAATARLIKLVIMRSTDICSDHIASAPDRGVFSPDGTKIAYRVQEDKTIGVDVYKLPEHICVATLKKFHAGECLPVWNQEGTRLIRRFMPKEARSFVGQLWRIDSAAGTLEQDLSNISCSRMSFTSETSGITNQPQQVITFQADQTPHRIYDSNNHSVTDKKAVHLAHYPTQEYIHIIKQGRSQLIDPAGKIIYQAEGIIKTFSADGTLMVEYQDKGDSWAAHMTNRSGTTLLTFDEALEKAFINRSGSKVVLYDKVAEDLFDLARPTKNPLLELESFGANTKRFLPGLESFLQITRNNRTNHSIVTHHSLDGSVLAQWDFPNYRIKNVGFCLEPHMLIFHGEEMGEKILFDTKTERAVRFNTDTKCSSSIKKQSPFVGRKGYYINQKDDRSYELRKMIDPDAIDFIALMKRVIKRDHGQDDSDDSSSVAS